MLGGMNVTERHKPLEFGEDTGPASTALGDGGPGRGRQPGRPTSRGRPSWPSTRHRSQGHTHLWVSTCLALSSRGAGRDARLPSAGFASWRAARGLTLHEDTLVPHLCPLGGCHARPSRGEMGGCPASAPSYPCLCASHPKQKYKGRKSIHNPSSLLYFCSSPGRPRFRFSSDNYVPFWALVTQSLGFGRQEARAAWTRPAGCVLPVWAARSGARPQGETGRRPFMIFSCL